MVQAHKNRIIFIVVTIILFKSTVFLLNAGTGLRGLLPETLDGWTRAHEEKSYTPENLHEYINGGAELYISYGFKKSFTRKYIANDQPDIQVDLFDMEISENAFGVFSHLRETEDGLFGQGSQYAPGRLLFWKDHYLVSILGSPETVQSKAAVFRLAKRIETAISSDGPLPEILERLPEDRLVKESIYFFHHYLWLNKYYFISHENILHIDSNTEAVFATYDTPEKKSVLLVIKYPGKTEAKSACKDFTKHYLPELSKTDMVKSNDNTWTGCKRAGKHLVIVFNAPDKGTVSALINNTTKKQNT